MTHIFEPKTEYLEHNPCDCKKRRMWTFLLEMPNTGNSLAHVSICGSATDFQPVMLLFELQLNIHTQLSLLVPRSDVGTHQTLV